MGTKKQRKNEDNFLEPVLHRLKPYWADVFDMMMRGKQRGDGLMLDDENLEQIEEGITHKVTEAKNEAKREVLEQEGYGDRNWRDVRYDDRLDMDKRQELDDLKREKMSLNLSEREEKMAYAVYMRNEIETSDRGSWISAKNLFNRLEDAIDTDLATVAAGVFGALRERPMFTPDPPSRASTNKISRAYGDSEEKARSRAKQRRSVFKQSEL